MQWRGTRCHGEADKHHYRKNRSTLSISSWFSKTIETAHVNRRVMNFFGRHKSVKNKGLSARIYASMTMVISVVSTFLRDSSVYVR